MKRHLPILLLTLFLSLFAHVNAADKPALIPRPFRTVWTDDTFVLKKGDIIGCDRSPQALSEAEYLQESLFRLTGIRPDIRQGEKGRIRIVRKKGQRGGYRLEVTGRHILLTGSDHEGVAGGIATLRQIIRDTAIPGVVIDDAPRFGWRGFHLDCSRHFFSKEEVKRYIDLMALYKFNRFHWHLTDDQGWRIEIKQLKALTDKSSLRTPNHQDSVCMAMAAKSHNDDLLLPAEKFVVSGSDSLYGGYYTQDDVREIVAYALGRGIETIPEIDMPGHMLAAIETYPHLSCHGTGSQGKVFSSPLCPSKDAVRTFCQTVWNEVVPLFPFEYVHLGGDEVEKEFWKACPDCQKRMAESGLKNEDELQAWFFHDMERYINRLGKKIIGWDEIIQGGLSKTATVMWWRSWMPHTVSEATRQGNRVIVNPIAPFYFSETEKPGSLRDIYDFKVVPDGLSARQRQLVMGVQGNLWTEWIPSFNRLMYMLFPRALALSELAWCGDGEKDFDDFSHRVTAHYDVLNRMDVAYRIPFLQNLWQTRAFTDSIRVETNCEDPTAVVRFTTDGSVPTVQSPILSNPVVINRTTAFTFRPFGKGGRAGDISRASYVKQGLLAALPRPDDLRQGLTVRRYEYEGKTCRTIGQSREMSVVQVDDVVIPEGMKGNIGLIIEGYIDIPADGIYTFALTSDDGSLLFIDGNTVVDNDREQPPHKEVGQVALKRGLHAIEVRYFDQNGGMLRLQVSDENQHILHPRDLYRRTSATN